MRQFFKDNWLLLATALFGCYMFFTEEGKAMLNEEPMMLMSLPFLLIAWLIFSNFPVTPAKNPIPKDP